MRNSLEKMTVEAIVQGLVAGTVDVNEVNVAKRNQRDAFLSAIKQRPNLLAKVKDENSDVLLPLAIRNDHTYLVYINRDQYTDALVQAFIFKRFDERNDKKGTFEKRNFIVQKSLDNKAVFNYCYTTADGEELYYNDKEFGIPTSIKSSFNIALKLVDAVKLVDKLDTHITQLGAEKIKNSIEQIVSTSYRIYLNKIIHEQEISYYNLCDSFDKIKTEFTELINTKLCDYGIVVSDFNMGKIAIPKDMQRKIENLAFQLRQRRADDEANSEMARASLDNYEHKLSIQSKYPDAPYTLTEYEKDMALKRYLMKIGRGVEDTVDSSIEINQTARRVDAQISKEDDIVPDIPVPKNKFRTNFIIMAVAAVVLSLIVMASNSGAGLIMLGAFVGIFGTVAAVCYDKLTQDPAAQIEPDAVNTEDVA